MPTWTLQVDITDLAETMDFAVPDGLASYLDLRNGEIVHPDASTAANDAELLLSIPPFDGAYRYNRMQQFAASVDRDLAGLLAVALDGNGAFRRFKNLIYQHGVADAWLGFQLGLDRAKAMDWLTAHNVTWIDISTRMPVTEPARESGTIGLADLLLLGSADGKSAVAAGRIRRRVPAHSPQHSRELFARLAREVCATAGISKPDPTGESDILDAGRFHLRRHHDAVDLEIDVTPELQARFTAS